MLYILFNKTEEEAEKIFNRKYLDWPDARFDYAVTDFNLYEDELFKEILLHVDNADMPMKNVVRDLYNEDTHSIHEVSTGVKVLWFAANTDGWFIPSEWLGENCYKHLFQIAEKHDIYLLENSNMFHTEYTEELVGSFMDVETGSVVELAGNDEGYDYVVEMGY